MTKLTGTLDPYVLANLAPLVSISGEEAFNKLNKLLRRITKNRLDETIRIIENLRYFGGRIQFVHLDDMDEEDLEYCWCYSDESNDALGTYSHYDAWVTIPLDRHKGWGSVEYTCRHESLHLLQDCTDTRPRVHDRDLPLLSKKLRWTEWLAEICEREFENDEDPIPLCEIEAHSVDTWVKTVADWTEEVKKRELWAGNWYCPLESDND